MKRLLTVGVVVALLQLTSGAAPPYAPWSAPVSLGSVVNSPYDDALPTLSKDGLSLYFTSNRPESEGGIGGYDIWLSQRPSTRGEWGTPVCLGAPLNTTTNEAGPALSRDGHWLFFHRTTAQGDFDIMASWREDVHDDFAWEEPFNLGPNINTTANDAGASFFEGDEGSPAELYFGSTRLGNFDIFVSRLQPDGTFGPAELVVELSSPQADQRPAIRFDGREIYLTSQRPGGLGAGDIWVSTRSSVYAAWNAPVNVRELNTAATDAQASLSAKGDVLIFNSNRTGAIGMTDLFVYPGLGTRIPVGGTEMGQLHQNWCTSRKGQPPKR